MEVTIVLHESTPSEEGRQHDLAGGGRGTEADGSEDRPFPVRRAEPSPWWSDVTRALGFDVKIAFDWR
jgi:hypothetical protein